MHGRIVITGINGFLGKNLALYLKQRGYSDIIGITRQDTASTLRKKLKSAATVFHLAGENRPIEVDSFEEVNHGFTREVLGLLEEEMSVPATFVFASSTQVLSENPYGLSKLRGEQAVKDFGDRGVVKSVIYRFPNIFGKWCKPYYNSVVATFCHNVSRAIPIDIHQASEPITLAYVDDVVLALAGHIDGDNESRIGVEHHHVSPIYETTVGDLASTIQRFHSSRIAFTTDSFEEGLTRKLFSTFCSYLDPYNLGLPAILQTDDRGSLFELIKNPNFGQIFVSKTNPGVTRGNHFHHSKVEKFCVIEGEGVIRFRMVDQKEIVEYEVSGIGPQVIDIPPGYTHSITNTGETQMITLFWASEIFDKARPDTIFEPVGVGDGEV